MYKIICICNKVIVLLYHVPIIYVLTADRDNAAGRINHDNVVQVVTLTIDQDRTRKDQLDAGDTVQVGDQPPTSREVFETKMNDRR